MDRRTLLKGSCTVTGLLSLQRVMMASQQCGPVFPAPYPPLHGMQQCIAGIKSVTFKQAYQQMNEWCWAACISMVFDYYGHSVSQSRIVSDTWGSVKDMPGQPSDILSDLNKDWTDDAGQAFTSEGDVLSVNAVTAVQDLQEDHPLIVGALGHAMVLTALTANTDLLTGQWGFVAATVRDPWPGNGARRILSPMEWANLSFAARVRVV